MAAAAAAVAVLAFSAGQTAKAVEVRGAASNPARFAAAAMSSTQLIDNANTGSEMAVDGNRGMHAQFDGCAVTEKQDSPWWRVDFGYRIPIAVVRLFGRSDEGAMYSVMTGIELRIGDTDTWSENEMCWGGENVTLAKRGASVANCIGSGRYLFVVAPKSVDLELSLCEVEVVPRGPSTVFEWQAAVGRRFDIGIEGQSLDPNDRVRIIDSKALCGAAGTFTMHGTVIPRSAPTNGPDEVAVDAEKWKGVVMTTMGFFKVCWCSGVASGSCVKGQDFTFVAGYVIVSGEFRTIVGPDFFPFVEPDDSPAAEFTLSTKNTDDVRGVTIDDTGRYLWFSEHHRVRQVDLVRGLVQTVVGSLTPMACNGTSGCGDDGPGREAGLFNPEGVSFCFGEVLIADSGNHRIRSYNPTTKVLTTVAGIGEAGFSGNGGPAIEARFNMPTSVACDGTNGFWVGDSRNFAIRQVESRRRRPSKDEATVRLSTGGLGQGLSQAGDWSSTAHINGISQVAITKDTLGYPRCVAYAETGTGTFNTPYMRYVPLIGNAITGPLQTAAGTGVEGWRATTLFSGDVEVRLNRPEGVAVGDNSVLFVADTGNHRLLMVPFVQYRSLGCWREYIADSSAGELVPSIEGDAEAALSGGDLTCTNPESADDDVLVQRPNALQECAQAAHKKGFKLFAIRCGGVCATSGNAGDRYSFIGRSDTCSLGRGGRQANSVYELVPGVAPDLLGRAWTLSGTAFATGRQPRAAFYGDWQSAWVSSVSYPSHLAYDSQRKNLYVVDRGNKRVRAIMGTLGPSPTNQRFLCLNGKPCELGISGNALSSKDNIGFARIPTMPDAEPVVCGDTRFEEHFANLTIAVDRSDWPQSMAIFSQKNFLLGVLELRSVGTFRICYCYGGELHACDQQEQYEFQAGSLEVYGPNSGHAIQALAGSRFEVLLFGNKLSQDDAIQLIPATDACGQESDQVIELTVRWIGCFEDDSERDFDVRMETLGNMANTTTCALACWNYTYMALQWGNCRCGNAYSTAPQYQQVDKDECGAPCEGEESLTPTRYCGSPWRNAVFRIKPNSTDGDAVAASGSADFVGFPAGGRSEGDEAYDLWEGAIALRATDLAICWCNRGGSCLNSKDFDVRAGFVYVRGPIAPEAPVLVVAGEPFDLVLEGQQPGDGGSGAFKSSDRVRLQPVGSPCRLAGDPVADLDIALPPDAAPCALSLTTVRWCGVMLSDPGEYSVCWCGSGRCMVPSDFRVLGLSLLVEANPDGAGGPAPAPSFSQPELPREPLDLDNAWPKQVTNGSGLVTVRALARQNVPGAASAGPIEFSVCESPERCLEPVVMTDLPADGAFTAASAELELNVGPSGPASEPAAFALRPLALRVQSLSSDAWLPEFVEVEFSAGAGGGLRRFPINRWLVAGGGWQSDALLKAASSDGVAPRALAPPAEIVYTPGDKCGGCALGFECVEVPVSALGLARLGFPEAGAASAASSGRSGSAAAAVAASGVSAAAAFEWACAPRCGDGLVVGEEQCDDSNLQAFDGCSSSCLVEAGMECFTLSATAPSRCKPKDCLVLVSDFQNIEACPEAWNATLEGLGTGNASNASNSPVEESEEQLLLPETPLISCRELAPSAAATCDEEQPWPPIFLDHWPGSAPELSVSCSSRTILEEAVALNQGQADRGVLCGYASSRPSALHASLEDGGHLLVVAFDAPVALAREDRGGEDACAALFHPETLKALGDGARCSWGSPRHVLVRLGFGAELADRTDTLVDAEPAGAGPVILARAAAEAAADLDVAAEARRIKVLDVARQQAALLNTTLSVPRPWELPSQQLGFVRGVPLRASPPPVPVVVLRGPVVAGACGDTHVQGVGAVVEIADTERSGPFMDSGGRPWLAAAWGCEGSSLCEQLLEGRDPCPSDGLDIRLGAGPWASCLEMRIPESVASQLGAQGATLQLSLTLTDMSGLSGTGRHSIRFTSMRAPVAAPISPADLSVPADPEHLLRLEVAFSAAEQGSCLRSKSLGPIGVTWRFGSRSQLSSPLSDLSGVFAELPTSSSSADTSWTGVFERSLGVFAMPGSELVAVARVAHASALSVSAALNAEPAFVAFHIRVGDVPYDWQLVAPSSVVQGCPFRATVAIGSSSPFQLHTDDDIDGSDEATGANTTNSSSDSAPPFAGFLVDFTCTKTDLVAPTGSEGANPCDGAMSSGMQLDLPADLAPGAYRLDAEVFEPTGAPGRYTRYPAKAAYFTVHAAGAFAAPVVWAPANGPASEVGSNGSRVLRQSASVLLMPTGFADELPAAAAACRGGDAGGDPWLHAAVLLRGSMPSSAVPIDLDLRLLASEVVVRPPASTSWTATTSVPSMVAVASEASVVNAQVDFDSLKAGLEYRFQLLVSADRLALSAFASRFAPGAVGAGAWPPPPDGVGLPSGIALYEGAPFARALPPPLALWASPAVGFASRTLFTLSARAKCDGCLFSFRYAALLEGPPVASDAADAADASDASDASASGGSASEAGADLESATPGTAFATDGSGLCARLDAGASDWRELRSWSLDPEIRTPFLAGNFTVEVRALRPDGLESRVCQAIEADEVDLGVALSGAASDADKTLAINTWSSDASRMLEVMRSAKDPATVASSVHAVARSFPSAAAVEGLPVEATLRLLFSEICDTVVDVVVKLPAEAFVGADRRRRLEGDEAEPPSMLLNPLAESLLMVTEAISSLLSLADLWQSLGVLRAFLDANAAVLGTMGSQGPEAPPPSVAALLGSGGVVLRSALSAANGTSSAVTGAIAMRNASSLAEEAMLAIRRLGDALAAAGPLDSTGLPLSVLAVSASSLLGEATSGTTSSSAPRLALTAASFSGAALAASGLSVQPPLDAVVRAPYPAVRLPPLGVAGLMQLINASATATATAAALAGDGAASAAPSCPVGSPAAAAGAGANPFEAFALVVVQWSQDPYSFGALAVAGEIQRVLVIRDVQLRSCGVDVPVGVEVLEEAKRQKVELVIEVPRELQLDTTIGYGSESLFRCVRWAPGAVDSSAGSWKTDGCASTFRAWGDLSDFGVNVSEGATHCACDGLWPGTWALEAVPAPLTKRPEEHLGSSSPHNLVTYCLVLLFLTHLPLAFLAWYGDNTLGLDTSEEEESAARLLPWGLNSGGGLPGARARAREGVAKLLWPMRTVFWQEALTVVQLLVALGRGELRDFRSAEVVEMPHRRSIAVRERTKRLAMRSARVAPADIAQPKPRQEPTGKWFGGLRVSRPPVPPSPANGGVGSIAQQQKQLGDNQGFLRLDEGPEKAPLRIGFGEMGGPQPKGEIMVGSMVRIKGLQGAKDLNGQLGTCESWDEDKGRWLVRLQSDQAVVKALRTDNLERASEVDWENMIRREVAEPDIQQQQHDQQRRHSVASVSSAQTYHSMAGGADAAGAAGGFGGAFGAAGTSAGDPAMGASPQPLRQTMPPPEGWIARKSDEHAGRYYWVNLLSGKSTWIQPVMPAVKELSVPEMHAILGGRADHVHLRLELEDMLRKRIAERMQDLGRDDLGDEDFGEDPLEFMGGGRGGPFARLDQEAPRAGGRRRMPDGVHMAGPPVAFGPPADEPAEASKAPPAPPKEGGDGGGSGLRGAAAAGDDRPADPGALATASPPAGTPGGAGGELCRSAPKPSALSSAADLQSQATTAKDDSDDGVVPFQIRLEFLEYRGLRILWLCWLRVFPLSSVLAPCLVRPRLSRAIALIMRHFFALGLAVVIASSQPWPYATADEGTLEAQTRPLGDLFAEMDLAIQSSDTVSLGIVCALGGMALAAMFTPASVLNKSAGPQQKESLQLKVTWWRRIRRRLKLGSLAGCGVCGVVAGCAGVLAARSPQPRASTAAAIFVLSLLMDFVAVPLLRAIASASLIGATGRSSSSGNNDSVRPCCCRRRRCCCGPVADTFASQLPAVLDFMLAQVQDWTSAEEVVFFVKEAVEEHRLAEALAAGEEPPQPLGAKVKRMLSSEDQKKPTPAAK